MQRVRPPSYTSSSPPRDANVLLSLQTSQSPFPSVHLAVTSGSANGQVRLPSLNTHKNRSTKRRVETIESSTEDERRRQRNRMHQARHKMKQRRKVDDLEASIQQLREEVQELKLQREVITVGVMSNTTVWNVAAEYFRVFRYGVKPRELMNSNSVMMIQPAALRADAQRSFLLSTMASTVVSETGYGVDSLMESWCFVSKFHPDIDIELICLENDEDGFMVGKTRGTLTITENTIHHAFPHLIEDGAERERMELVDKLLGQQLIMRGAIHFEWDTDNKRIARVLHKADLLKPLLSLLGSLEDVSRVFDNALVTPDSTSVAWNEQRVHN
ncbi:hypothetical protein PHMEG_0004244 [Phytophthora megakarya]|uniref:BZIP domain-containing protein n=1 Tax=Phytophthora megakarya TaxID=4795 RepID=A0A225WWM7_9STRA|nr:hypothetical protein PHMEG_0004244 [Phytophthora megakarya]